MRRLRHTVKLTDVSIVIVGCVAEASKGVLSGAIGREHALGEHLYICIYLHPKVVTAHSLLRSLFGYVHLTVRSMGSESSGCALPVPSVRGRLLG